MTGVFNKMNFNISKRCLTSIRFFFHSSRACQSVQQVKLPPSESDPLVISPKIDSLVNEIGKLTLIEASELNIALKKKFNLPDFTPSFGAAVTKEQDDEAAAPVMKSNFTVKLQKFDEKKKIALIKEIKALLTDLNLVQAKKFVESAPVVIKADISQEEAQALKETLEKAGAECSIN